MAGSPSKLRPDGTHWVYRTKYVDPWFAASLADNGCIVFSVSYSNFRYVRNFADCFDMALRVAGLLDARLFEEVGGREVTSTSIDELLAPRGEYVKLQVGTFRGTLEKVESGSGALEFPLGPIDLVSPYFVYHLVVDKPPKGPVDNLIPSPPSGMHVEVLGANAGMVVNSATHNPVTKVLIRPDDKVQVWTAFGPEPFAEVAAKTRDTARGIATRLHAKTLFCGTACTPELESGIDGHLSGLGVEFYEWFSKFKTNPR